MQRNPSKNPIDGPNSANWKYNLQQMYGQPVSAQPLCGFSDVNIAYPEVQNPNASQTISAGAQFSQVMRNSMFQVSNSTQQIPLPNNPGGGSANNFQGCPDKFAAWQTPLEYYYRPSFMYHMPFPPVDCMNALNTQQQPFPSPSGALQTSGSRQPSDMLLKPSDPQMPMQPQIQIRQSISAFMPTNMDQTDDRNSKRADPNDERPIRPSQASDKFLPIDVIDPSRISSAKNFRGSDEIDTTCTCEIQLQACPPETNAEIPERSTYQKPIDTAAYKEEVPKCTCVNACTSTTDMTKCSSQCTEPCNQKRKSIPSRPNKVKERSLSSTSKPIKRHTSFTMISNISNRTNAQSAKPNYEGDKTDSEAAKRSPRKSKSSRRSHPSPSSKSDPSSSDCNLESESEETLRRSTQAPAREKVSPKSKSCLCCMCSRPNATEMAQSSTSQEELVSTKPLKKSEYFMTDVEDAFDIQPAAIQQDTQEEESTQLRDPVYSGESTGLGISPVDMSATKSSKQNMSVKDKQLEQSKTASSRPSTAIPSSSNRPSLSTRPRPSTQSAIMRQTCPSCLPVTRPSAVTCPPSTRQSAAMPSPTTRQSTAMPSPTTRQSAATPSPSTKSSAVTPSTSIKSSPMTPSSARPSSPTTSPTNKASAPTSRPSSAPTTKPIGATSQKTSKAPAKSKTPPVTKTPATLTPVTTERPSTSTPTATAQQSSASLHKSAEGTVEGNSGDSEEVEEINCKKCCDCPPQVKNAPFYDQQQLTSEEHMNIYPPYEGKKFKNCMNSLKSFCDCGQPLVSGAGLPSSSVLNAPWDKHREERSRSVASMTTNKSSAPKQKSVPPPQESFSSKRRRANPNINSRSSTNGTNRNLEKLPDNASKRTDKRKSKVADSTCPCPFPCEPFRPNTANINCDSDSAEVSNYLEDVQLAVNLEKKISKNNTNDVTIVVRFPDPVINIEEIKNKVPDILNINCETSLEPRSCTVQLVPQTNVEQAIQAINKVPFGNGFLKAEPVRLTAGGNGRSKPIDTELHNIDPYTLYMGNLPRKIAVSAIKEEFPNARRIDVGYGHRLKKTRYAFVRFHTFAETQRAYRHAIGLKFNAKPVIVRFKRIKPVADTLPKVRTLNWSNNETSSSTSRTSFDMELPDIRNAIKPVCSVLSVDNSPSNQHIVMGTPPAQDDVPSMETEAPAWKANEGNLDSNVKVEYCDEYAQDGDTGTSSNLLGLHYDRRIEEVKTEPPDSSNSSIHLPSYVSVFDSDFQNTDDESMNAHNAAIFGVNVVPVKRERSVSGSGYVSNNTARVVEVHEKQEPEQEEEQRHEQEQRQEQEQVQELVDRKPTPRICSIVSDVEISLTHSGYCETATTTTRTAYLQNLYATTREYREAHRRTTEYDSIYRQMETDDEDQ